MPYVTVAQADSELTASGQTDGWGTLSDAQKGAFLERATDRFEMIPFQGDGDETARPRYVDGVVNGGEAAIPLGIKLAVVNYALWLARNPLENYHQPFGTLSNSPVKGLFDVPALVQNGLWPYLDRRFRAGLDPLPGDEPRERKQAASLEYGSRVAAASTPSPGGGASAEEIAAAVEAHREDADAHHAPPEVPAWAQQPNPPQNEGNQSAYAYLAKPSLTQPAVGTDQSIGDTGDGYKHTLVDEFAGPAGIVPGADFITEWEGSFAVEVATACNLEVILRTTHKFGSPEKTLVHERSVFHDLVAGVRQTFSMTAYYSRSTPVAGTYGSVTVTEADIRGESEITYDLELRTYQRKSESTRIANTLKAFVGHGIETASYQLRQAVVGGDGTIVAPHTPASGDAELAGLDIAGTDYEITDREGRDRLHAVEQKVHPIREVPQTWADISDGSAGWSAPAGLLTSVTPIAALTFANTNRTGTAAQFVYVRIPVGAIQSNYRFQYTITGGSQAGETHNRVLGTWSGERVGADSSWQYYRISFYEGSGFSGGKLQLGGSDLFEWEGSLTQKAVEDQLDAIGVPQQIDALKNVTRDLHLDGATRLVKNSAAATAGVARVAVSNSARQAIEAGTQSLNVQGVTFTAALANAHFGSTATTTDLPVIRLAKTENRSDWRILFDDTAFLAGGWVPINVSNGSATHDYYISGKVDRTKEIALYKSTEETTYHGALADDIVDIDALAAAVVARLLPTLPNAGSRDGKSPRFDGNTLKWLAAAGGGGHVRTFTTNAAGRETLVANTWLEVPELSTALASVTTGDIEIIWDSAGSSVAEGTD
ncbi:MAG: hypothetical protein F4Y92_01955, partial [Dehalococcoidia bacterium]|nr:hypothetical protein [Dehalococcoidia bacterium]